MLKIKSSPAPVTRFSIDLTNNSVMRKEARKPKGVPLNRSADPRYVALLLREEEMVEALRVVDLAKASEMDNELDKILHKPSTEGPWGYLEDADTMSSESRLAGLELVIRTREEADEAAEAKAQEDDIREEKARQIRQRSRKDSVHDHSTPNNNNMVVKQRSPKRPPSHNGEYSWSARVYDIKQRHKYALKDELREWEINNFVKTGVYRSKTFAHQFEQHNRRRDGYPRHSDELAYRPIDAARYFVVKESVYSLVRAAKKIRFVVTQH